MSQVSRERIAKKDCVLRGNPRNWNKCLKKETNNHKLVLDGIISLVLSLSASAGPLALGTWWTLQKAQNIAVKQKSFIFVRAHPEFFLEGLKRDVIFDQVVRGRLQCFRNDEGFSLVSADDFRMFWARRMVDGVWAEWNDRTRVLSLLSTLLTL